MLTLIYSGLLQSRGRSKGLIITFSDVLTEFDLIIYHRATCNSEISSTRVPRRPVTFQAAFRAAFRLT